MLALLVMMGAPLSDWRLQIRQAPPWIELIAAQCLQAIRVSARILPMIAQAEHKYDRGSPLSLA
jgi:hypothetical protein